MLALVRRSRLDDLNACAARSAAWRSAGLATPLLLTRDDFARSLDAFPIEYGEIIASHELVVGRDPFDGLVDSTARICGAPARCRSRATCSTCARTTSKAATAVCRRSKPGARVGAGLCRAAPASRPARTAPPRDTPSDLVALRARSALGLDRARRRRSARARRRRRTAAVDAGAAVPRVSAAIERLAEFVDRWRDA